MGGKSLILRNLECALTGGVLYSGLSEAKKYIEKADKEISKNDYSVSGKTQLADELWETRQKIDKIYTRIKNLRDDVYHTKF